MFRWSALESDIPERSVRRIGPLDEHLNWPDWPRPVRLLSPPEPVENVMAVLPDGAAASASAGAAESHSVRRADGPERIYGEWWRRSGEADAVRDYFQVEDEEGAPLLDVSPRRRRRRAHRRPQLVPARAVRMTYVELQVATHFSFLRGVSSAEELFSAAALLGYPALGITDRNSVGGLVKALRAADATGVRLVAGCRLDLMDGSSLLVWPEDRAAWSRLTRLLTVGKSRVDRRKGEKGQCFLHWEDVAAWSDGLVAALVPDEADRGHRNRPGPDAPISSASRAYLALTHRRRPGDALRLHALDALARRYGVRSLATGDVLYDSPDKRMLQDVVTAIRNKCTIDELGFRRERYRRPPPQKPATRWSGASPLSPTRSAPPPTSPSAAPSRCANSATNIPTRS